MKTPAFNFNDLPIHLMFLESGLRDLRFEGPGIWPLCELNDADFHEFIRDLYKLAHDALAMHYVVFPPPRVAFVPTTVVLYGYPDLIRCTRELIWCCDLELILAYRPLHPGEYETIRLLEQTHAQLIGAFYGRRAGEEEISADMLRFTR